MLSTVLTLVLIIVHAMQASVEAQLPGKLEPPSPKTPRAPAQAGAALGEAAPAAPKTPELARNASALSCFGLGPKAAAGEDNGEEVESSKSSAGSDAPLPRGMVGLRNNGASSLPSSTVHP